MSYIYTRKPNYYETDMMGIVHHSNYIRYFEEARLAYMDTVGCDVAKMEKEGIIIPNVDAYAKYLIPVRYGETVKIEAKLTMFTGTRMELNYTVYKENRDIAAVGHTMHCFVNEDFKPISLKRKFPAYFQLLSNMIEE